MFQKEAVAGNWAVFKFKGIYSESCQTTKTKRFAKVHGRNLLTIFAKCSILDAWKSSAYASEVLSNYDLSQHICQRAAGFLTFGKCLMPPASSKNQSSFQDSANEKRTLLFCKWIKKNSEMYEHMRTIVAKNHSIKQWFVQQTHFIFCLILLLYLYYNPLLYKVKYKACNSLKVCIEVYTAKLWNFLLFWKLR